MTEKKNSDIIGRYTEQELRHACCDPPPSMPVGKVLAMWRVRAMQTALINCGELDESFGIVDVRRSRDGGVSVCFAKGKEQ